MTLGLWPDRATSILSKSSTEGARASSCSSCVAKSKLSVVDSTAMGTCQSRYDCPTKSGSILRTFNLLNAHRCEPIHAQPHCTPTTYIQHEHMARRQHNMGR